MKKTIHILALCFIMLFAAASVSAQETEIPAEGPAAEGSADGFKVTYLENDCLALAPADNNAYAAGTEVTVLFEPVRYKDYLIFYGWDMNNDGIADFGYNYNKFIMPENDVEMKAICIGAYLGTYQAPAYRDPHYFTFGSEGTSTSETYVPDPGEIIAGDTIKPGPKPRK